MTKRSKLRALSVGFDEPGRTFHRDPADGHAIPDGTSFPRRIVFLGTDEELALVLHAFNQGTPPCQSLPPISEIVANPTLAEGIETRIGTITNMSIDRSRTLQERSRSLRSSAGQQKKPPKRQ